MNLFMVFILHSLTKKLEKMTKTIPLSSSSPIKSDLFGLFDFGVRTDLVGLAVTLYCG